MSLHLHRAERSDRLVGGLADLLAEPLPDPFATEIVAVPTRGVERWLAQQVSDRLGVCAGVDFPSVRRLVADALEPVTAVDSQSDPWQPSRAVWPILAIVDAARDETWAELLWSHLRGGSEERPRGGRRWLTARRAAVLFARYASERPELLARWRAGEDVDSAGRALRIDQVWQAELFRRLRAELSVPSPDERLPAALADLAAGAIDLELPERLSVFGLTGLDRTQHRVLVALAGQRDVHLWLTHPSPVLWDTLAARASAGSERRQDDTSLDAVRHRLLGYLGRDSRELQLVLRGAQPHDHHLPGPSGAEPAPCSVSCNATSPETPIRARARSVRCWSRTTAVCRSTPPTVRSARSRCCGSCWWGCSTTTRPWNPATSWCSAPTSSGSPRSSRRRSDWPTTTPRPSTPDTGSGCGWPTGPCAG